MEFTIRAATESDMLEISEVHRICFPDSFSTKLGNKLLSKYYFEFYLENPSLFYVCENENGKICGFVMGYILGRTNAISSFMKKNRVNMAFKVFLQLLLLDKLVWKKVANLFKKKKASSSEPATDKDGQGDLLSICVTDEMKGSGAASALVEKYEEAVKDLGCGKCYLTCETSNPRGLAFYKKLGYSIDNETQNKICFRKDLD
ncbi:MAG: GNAT family N-acetyltransferase [Clostridia bacterium]|nr:GNAT family N-acetyltransferase [Clostridia bacterium]